MIDSPDIAVWLYGSHARGDADAQSDVDVLVVSDREVCLKDLGAFTEGAVPPSVTQYAWSEIAAMSQYGSLFLRHVQREGQILFESESVEGELSRMLSSIGAYKFAARDISGFRAVVTDVRESLEGGGSRVYELSVLGTVVRHASILGCALSGSYCFSRYGPVARIVDELRLPEELAAEFPSLYWYRIMAEGREASIGRGSYEDPLLWCERADSLLDVLEARINGFH